MTDDDFDLVCSNLLALARFDDAMAALFRDYVGGDWASVDTLYRTIEPPPVAITPTLRVSWLAAPEVDGYAIVVFFETATMWSFTATYNVGRLRNKAPRST